MKLVLSGPMAHLPNSNYPAFEQAKEQLEEAGYEVLTPVGLANAAQLEVANRLGVAFRDTYEYDSIMIKALAQVTRADGMCQLNGWRNSYGARAEYWLAKSLSIPVGTLADWLHIPLNARSFNVRAFNTRSSLPNQLLGTDQAAGPPPTLKWTGDSDLQPRRIYPGDAGYDLICSIDTRVQIGQFVDVPCGIKIELPEGVWGLITGRSSTLRERGLLVTQGIIDNGYRGWIFAGVQNLSETVVDIKQGERIAQLILHPIIAPEPKLVETLSESDRGTNAFGSSGR
jgi:dUTP pyrophosphatase